MKKSFKLLSAALIALISFAPSANAGELVVCDGDDNSSYFPVYGFYYDQQFHDQMIYPVNMLYDMVGKNITSITFYPNSALEYQGGKLRLSLKESEMDRFGSYDLQTDCRIVADLVPTVGDNELVFVFDRPYYYDGGNLLIDCELIEPGRNYPSITYQGKSMGYVCSLFHYGYNSQSDVDYFLPKVTFTYEDGTTPTPVEMVYTVVGPEDVFGTNWNVNDPNNELVKGEDGVYTWSKENVALYGNFEFKVVGNHSYDIYEWPVGMNNWVANVAEEGIYTIEITFNPEAAEEDRIGCTLTKTGDVEHIEHVYTVAGTDNLFGSYWDTNDEANNMVKGDDGIYTWTKNGVEFAAEEVVEFKVVQDHSWTYAWPSNNWWYKAEEAGKYDVVITFNADTKEITFTATPVTEPGFEPGDVNHDGEISIGDITVLIDYMLNDVTAAPAEADFNGDQTVSIGDVTDLIDYMLNAN